MNKAIFLDKDGTLIPDIPYNVNPSQITLYPDTGTSLARLRAFGFKLFIISNQSGVAQGLFPEYKLSKVWDRLTQLLSPFGAEPDGVYYCPHYPGGVMPAYSQACSCRKPQPGLLLRAAQEHTIDLSRSWMVGDILNDVEAGNRAGCRTVLIDRGNETEWFINTYRLPTARANSLMEATDYILANDAKRVLTQPFT
ncbi:D-glycero-alpha-D-manno-heptose-1,7-bisphosphate 7-phosphatase [Spirosoma aerophilum]